MENVFVLLKETQIGDPLEGTDKMILEYQGVCTDFETVSRLAHVLLLKVVEADINFMAVEDPEGHWCTDDYAINNERNTGGKVLSHTITLYRRDPDSLSGRLKIERFVVAETPVKSMA